jgi:DNA invertase Pin-like site-specific DNA recombinase
VDLYLHQQAMDTTTDTGRAFFQMLGVFAEFERSLITSRVQGGIDRAKAAGKRIGRPPTGADLAEKITTAIARGNSVRKTARLYGVGISTVQRLKGARG